LSKIEGKKNQTARAPSVYDLTKQAPVLRLGKFNDCIRFQAPCSEQSFFDVTMT